MLKSIAICPAQPDYVAALLACDDPKHFLDWVRNLATRDQYPDAARRLENEALGVAESPYRIKELNEAIKLNEQRVRLVADLNRTLLASLLDQRLSSDLKSFRVATALGLVSGTATTAARFTFEHLSAFIDRPNKAALTRVALAALGYLPSHGGPVRFDQTIPLPVDRRERAALALHCLIRAFYGGRP